MPNSVDMAPDRHVIVFEAANADLKEVYVAWTSRPIFQAMAELDARRPSVITHWHPQHQNIAFRSLEFNLPEDEAQAFITRLVAKHLSDGRDRSHFNNEISGPTPPLANTGTASMTRGRRNRVR